MQQHWNIRSRTHHCALTNRPFEEGEKHHTAIYFDTGTGELMRRDICNEAWEQEISERTPLAHWKSVYEKTVTEAKPEITPKESAIVLLQRLIDEDQSHTEHARYILALMLERKRVLTPTATKENDEGHRLLFYENRKTGDVYMVRDPELRLDEIASVQEEVASLLGFGGPVAEAAKVAGVTIGPDGKIQPAAEPVAAGQPEEAPAEPEAIAENTAVEDDAGEDQETGTEDEEEDIDNEEDPDADDESEDGFDDDEEDLDEQDEDDVIEEEEIDEDAPEADDESEDDIEDEEEEDEVVFEDEDEEDPEEETGESKS